MPCTDTKPLYSQELFQRINCKNNTQGQDPFPKYWPPRSEIGTSDCHSLAYLTGQENMQGKFCGWDCQTRSINGLENLMWTCCAVEQHYYHYAYGLRTNLPHFRSVVSCCDTMKGYHPDRVLGRGLESWQSHILP